MAAPGCVDPTKPTKYPIILSDALLGKTSKETYTGVRCKSRITPRSYSVNLSIWQRPTDNPSPADNHRPTLSSDNAPSRAVLKRSARDGSYNLGFDDRGERYQYNGTRTSEDGNYVLIFDPARKAFVLHRVDSLFHMNLTKTPADNVESLRKQFPQLEVKSTGKDSTNAPGKQQKAKDAAEKAAPSKSTGPGKGKAKENANAATRETATKGRKTKADRTKPVELTMPDPSLKKTPSPLPPPPPASAPVLAQEEKKSKRRARSPVESEEEDNDDDIGLTIEYPDGEPSNFQPSFPTSNNFNPPFPTRRFSEFLRSNEVGEEDDDADAEFDDDMVEDEDEEEEDRAGFKLPSPVNRHKPIEPPARFEFETNAGGDEDADADGDEFDEADLEAELEKEWARVGNEVSEEGPGQGHDSDSSMSEEE